jgi:hypothetical protein
VHLLSESFGAHHETGVGAKLKGINIRGRIQFSGKTMLLSGTGIEWCPGAVAPAHGPGQLLDQFLVSPSPCAPRHVLPERWLTLYSEDIGNTISLYGRTMCLGRSVIKWKNVFGLLPVYSMVRRWRVCAVSLVFPGRPVTRFLTATRIKDSKA